MNEIKISNQKKYYSDKIKDINFLESRDYRILDDNQKEYRKKINLYMIHKEHISSKLRLLEVYEGLWENIEIQLDKQILMNEEFWNTIIFNIIKYNEWSSEIGQDECNQKKRDVIEEKMDKLLWEQRKEQFMLIKEELNGINSNFNSIHNEIYDRTLLQKKCIDQHISWLRSQCESLENMKTTYKNIFYTIQKEIGQKGNRISKRALNNYKRSLLQKVE